MALGQNQRLDSKRLDPACLPAAAKRLGSWTPRAYSYSQHQWVSMIATDERESCGHPDLEASLEKLLVRSYIQYHSC